MNLWRKTWGEEWHGEKQQSSLWESRYYIKCKRTLFLKIQRLKWTSKIQSLTPELYSSQWEEEREEKSKNTENMESHELSDGKSSERIQKEGWKEGAHRKEEGTRLNVLKTGNEEKFLNTSRKMKEKSLYQTPVWHWNKLFKTGEIRNSTQNYSENVRIKDVLKYATFKNDWAP